MSHTARPGAAASASLVLGLAILAWVPPPAAQARIFSQWVELGPDGMSSARAITDEACPLVVFDGMPTPMSIRSEPGQKIDNVKPAAFPVRSCEVAVPQGAVAATLDGRALPLARPNPQRILVFGDTGCRLDQRASQDCNDPAAWPFPKIVAAAANARPDLVIHVGDYHYRESPCPAERSGCTRSPWGYGFDAWYVDFFEPAAPLLAAAPWIMVRGNHEDCARAGEGWVRFLDRLPASAICRDLTGIFLARLGDFGVVVVDGARAEDPKGDMGALARPVQGGGDQSADRGLARIPQAAQFHAQRVRSAGERGREYRAGTGVRGHHAGRCADGGRGPHSFLSGGGFWRLAPAPACGRHRR